MVRKKKKLTPPPSVDTSTGTEFWASNLFSRYKISNDGNIPIQKVRKNKKRRLPRPSRSAAKYHEVDYLNQEEDEYFGKLGPKLVSPKFHSPSLRMPQMRVEEGVKTAFPLISDTKVQRASRLKESQLHLKKYPRRVKGPKGLRKVATLLEQVRSFSRNNFDISEIFQDQDTLPCLSKHENRNIKYTSDCTKTNDGEQNKTETTASVMEGCKGPLDFMAYETYSSIETIEIDLKPWSNIVNDKTVESLFRQNSSCCYLDLSGCVNITDDGLVSCVSFSSGLETLYIAGCSRITDKGVKKAMAICGESIFDLNISRRYRDFGGQISIGELILTDASIISISKNCKNLRRVVLQEQSMITNTGVKWLSNHCKNLSFVDLTACKQINGDGVYYLGEQCHRSLASIRISDLKFIDDSGFKGMIGQSFYLRELEASGLELITDIGIRQFVETKVFWGYRQHSGFYRLTMMNLSKCKLLTDVAMGWIATGCPNLTILNISGCPKIQDYGLKAIGSLNKLESLDISLCEAFTDVGLQYLIHDNRQLQQLQNINLSYLNGERISDEGLIPIVRSIGSQLHTLTAYELPGASDSFLRLLAKTSGSMLHCLRLSGNSLFTAGGVGAFGKYCYHLETLVIQGCNQIENDALKSIKNLRHLKHLDVTQCQSLGSSSMSVLPNWKLCYLSLGDTMHTNDDSIDAIAMYCHELKKLNISLCEKVTDKSVTGLLRKRCPYLLELNAFGCENVSYDALVQFASSHHRKEYYIEVVEFICESPRDLFQKILCQYGRCSFSSIYSEHFRGCRPIKDSRNQIHQRNIITQQTKEKLAIVVLQCATRSYFARKLLYKLETARAELKHWASKEIQRIIRGRIARLLANFEKQEQTFLALRLQYLWRKFWTKKQKQKAIRFWRNRTLASGFHIWMKNATSQRREREESEAKEKFMISLEFWATNIRKTLIKAWIKYTRHSKWKKERLPKAIKFWKNRTCRKLFSNWKDVCSAKIEGKKKLVTIFLQCVSIESRNARTAKSQVYVATHYNNKILKRRCIKRLKLVVSNSKRNMEAALVFMRTAFFGNTGKLVFRSWRMYTILAIRIRGQEEAVRLLTTKFSKKRVIYMFHSHARRKITSRENRHRALILLLHQTKYSALNTWKAFFLDEKLNRQKFKRAISFLKNSTLRKVFTNWLNRTKRQLYNRDTVAKSIHRLKLRSTTKAFCAWYSNIISIKLFKKRILQNMKNRTAGEVMRRWQLFYEISKSERHKQLEKWVRMNALAAVIQSRWRGVMGREVVEDKRLLTQLMCIRMQAFSRMCLAKFERRRQIRYDTLKEFLRAEKETDRMAQEDSIANELVREYKAARLCQQYYRAKHSRDLAYIGRGLRATAREKKRIEDAKKLALEHERKEQERKDEHNRKCMIAVKIQKSFRGMIGRIRFRDLWVLKYLNNQALRIQSNYRVRVAIRQACAKRRVNKFKQLTLAQTRKNTKILRLLGLRNKYEQLRYGDQLHKVGLHPNTFALEFWRLRDDVREDAGTWKRFALNQVQAYRRGGLDSNKRKEITRAYKERLEAEAWIRKGDTVQITDPSHPYRAQTGYVLNVVEVPRIPGGEQAVVKLDKKGTTVFIPLLTTATASHASHNSMIRVANMRKDWESTTVTSAKLKKNKDAILEYAKEERKRRQAFLAALCIQRCWRGRKLRIWLKYEIPKQKQADEKQKAKVLARLKKIRSANARTGRILVKLGILKRRHIPAMPERPIIPEWVLEGIETFQRMREIRKIAKVVVEQRYFRLKTLRQRRKQLRIQSKEPFNDKDVNNDPLDDNLMDMRWRYRSWWKVLLWKMFERLPEKGMIKTAESIMHVIQKIHNNTPQRGEVGVERMISQIDEERANDKESADVGDTGFNEEKGHGFTRNETFGKDIISNDSNVPCNSEILPMNVLDETSDQVNNPQTSRTMVISKIKKEGNANLLSVEEILKRDMFDVDDSIFYNRMALYKHVLKEISIRGLARFAKLIGGPCWRMPQDLRNTWVGLYQFKELKDTFHLNSKGWAVFHGTWENKKPNGYGVAKFLYDVKEHNEDEEQSLVSMFRIIQEDSDHSESDSDNEDDEKHKTVNWNYREYLGYCSDDSDGIDEEIKTSALMDTKTVNEKVEESGTRVRKPHYEYETIIGQVDNGVFNNEVKIIMRNRSTYIGPYVPDVNYKEEIEVGKGHYGIWKTYNDEVIYEGDRVTNHFDEENINMCLKITTKQPDEIYTGQVRISQRHGYGTCIFQNGDVYEGNWVMGSRDGFGKYVSSDKTCSYEGEWKHDKKHGKGSEIFSDGGTYVGEYKDSVFHGKGRLRLSNGDIYEGEFVDSLYEGHGKMIYADACIYEGSWKQGLRHSSIGHGAGISTFIDVDKNKFEVPFVEDLMDGQGVYYPYNLNGYGCEKYGLWHQGRLIRWFRFGINEATTSEFNKRFQTYGDYKTPFAMIISHELPNLPPGVDPENRSVEQHVHGILQRAGPLAATKVVEKSGREYSAAKTLSEKLIDQYGESKDNYRRSAELLQKAVRIRDLQRDLVAQLQQKIDTKKSEIVAFWDRDDPKHFRNRYRNAVGKVAKATKEDWHNCRHVHNPPSIYLRLWRAVARLLGNLNSKELDIKMLVSNSQTNKEYGDESALIRNYEVKILDDLQYNFDVYRMCKETALVGLAGKEVYDHDMKPENIELTQVSDVIPNVVTLMRAMFFYIRKASEIVDKVDELRHLKKQFELGKRLLITQEGNLEDAEEELRDAAVKRNVLAVESEAAKQKAIEIKLTIERAEACLKIAKEASDLDLDKIEPDDAIIVRWISREDEAIQNEVSSKLEDMIDLVCNIDMDVWDTIFTVKELIVAEDQYQTRYNAKIEDDEYIPPAVRDLVGEMINKVAGNDKENHINRNVELQVADTLNRICLEISGPDRSVKDLTATLAIEISNSYEKEKRKKERETEFLNNRVAVRRTVYEEDGSCNDISLFGTVTAIYDSVEAVPADPVPGSGLIFCDNTCTIFGYEDTTHFIKELMPGYVIRLPVTNVKNNENEDEVRFEERTVTHVEYDYQLCIDEPFSHLCQMTNWSKDWAYRNPFDIIREDEIELCDIVFDDGEVEQGINIKRVQKLEKVESDYESFEEENDSASEESDENDFDGCFNITDWVEYIHEESGNQYWHNPKKQITTWSEPFEFRKAKWKQFYEPNSKAIFWFNSESNETTWIRPT